jgi:hypothetical protein
MGTITWISSIVSPLKSHKKKYTHVLLLLKNSDIVEGHFNHETLEWSDLNSLSANPTHYAYINYPD